MMQVMTTDIKKWMSEMEEFIRPFTEPFTSVVNLREQLAESKVLDLSFFCCVDI